MEIYMVTSQRAQKTDPHYYIDEIKLFSNLDTAKIYAKHKLEHTLEIFGISKEQAEISEQNTSDNANFEEKYSIHASFQHESREWNTWVIVQKKEVE